MLSLRNIGEYINSTTEIIAIVSNMDVIICDKDCNVLGDSAFEAMKDCDHREDYGVLSNHSIVRESMEKQEVLIIEDNKNQNPACRQCVNGKTCLISSIIAYPIIMGGIPVGGIGLYAITKDAEKTLLKNIETLIEFIRRISELIIAKLKEQEENFALQAMHERLHLLVESLDDAIIGMDEEAGIININSNFYKMFSSAIGKHSINKIQDVCQALKNHELKEFVEKCLNEKAYERTMLRIKNFSMTVTFKPVLVGNVYKGALLYFKKNSEIYAEFNRINNNYSNVTFSEIVGSSEKLSKLKKMAEHFSGSPSTIFIHGKSGTGKEMFARAIHSASLVSNGPFITVNCAAIPEALLESELFGHKEGAFTGSMRGGKVGKFEFANKGTLFLDEVGELPLHLQPKLLRAIQDRKIQRVGSNEDIPVDIRIIAATNRDVEEMIEKGEFREDLYYRLNVIPLHIPELCQRKEDILELMELFLEEYNKILGKTVLGFEEPAQKLLYNYSWPGNIRELQNVVEYAVNDCSRKYISVENLPVKNYLPQIAGTNLHLQSMASIEKLCIEEALRIYGNTPEGKEEAARVLGMGRSTFYRKLKEMKL